MSISLYQRYFDCLATTDKRIMGIIDSKNVIVACTDPELVGQTEDKVKGFCLKKELDFDKSDRFVIFVQDKEQAVLDFLKNSLFAFKTVNREFDDEEYFFQQIINDKVENLSWKAQCLGVPDGAIRVVFVINISPKNIEDAKIIIKETAPVRDCDYLFANSANEIVFIRKCKSEPSNIKLTSIAQQISAGIMESLFEQPSIGIGNISTNLSNLDKSYKTAINALNIGYVFENKNRIYSHMNLGLSRLVTSISIEKCKAFLNEVLKADVLSEIDNETMTTVQRFLDCDLNVSLAARELYIHRNTLVFRLDKVKNLTGLDVRKFDDAMLWKTAMLIHRYLRASRR